MICFPPPTLFKLIWFGGSPSRLWNLHLRYVHFFWFDFSLVFLFGSSTLSVTSQAGCVAFIPGCFSCYGPLSFWFWPGRESKHISGWFLFQSLLFPLLYILKIGQTILSVPPPHRRHVQNSYLYFSLNKHLSLMCLCAAASFESGHGFSYAVCKHTTSQN